MVAEESTPGIGHLGRYAGSHRRPRVTGELVLVAQAPPHHGEPRTGQAPRSIGTALSVVLPSRMGGTTTATATWCVSALARRGARGVRPESTACPQIMCIGHTRP